MILKEVIFNASTKKNHTGSSLNKVIVLLIRIIKYYLSTNDTLWQTSTSTMQKYVQIIIWQSNVERI